MEFIEAPAFTRHISDYLSADEYQSLQGALIENPHRGDLMPGSGGFRKLRWGDARRGKGRRSGLRVIYYYFMSDQQIWLMTVYDKNEATDLAPADMKMIKAALMVELKERGLRKTKKKAVPKGRRN